MILEFSIENFYSFKYKVTFSMVGSSSDVLPSNYMTVGDNKILKCAAIYGANASGKSNIFKVLNDVVMMLRSSNSSDYSDNLAIVPFAFNNEIKPSKFEIRFIYEDIRYIYGFSATKKAIEEEYLYYFPNGKETKIFYRKNDNYTFTVREAKELKMLVNKNTSNKFFLATATNWNYEKTRPAYLFLTKHIVVWQNISNLNNLALKKYYEDKELKDFALEFLKKAYINITDFRVERVDDIKTIGDKFIFNFNDYHVYFKHANMEKDLYIENESLGTKVFFYLLPFLKSAFNNSEVLIVDELDRSLHPFLVEYIISLFNDCELNKNGSQLIFNTHDTNLLNLNLFRKDQIWFTEKNENAVSDLYSLSDFAIRKNENIEKGYMLGRYGAIPLITNDINLWQED